MKNIKSSILIAFAFFLMQNIYAQEHPHHPHHEMRTQKIEKFKADLNLSTEQEEAIEKIREKYRTERESLKNKTTEDRHVMHEKMQGLTKAQSEEIENVLTAEQQKTLEEKLEGTHEERFERRQQHQKQRKALHKKAKKYHNENITPVMLEQRAKLEEKISIEDKAKLEELRPIFSNLHERRIKKHDELSKFEKPMKKEERQAFHEEHKKSMEQYKPQMDLLHELVDKYEDDINVLLAELEEDRKVWREDMRELHDEHIDKNKKERHEKRRRHHSEEGKPHHEHGGMHIEGKKMRKGHFLLLDPNAEASEMELTNNIKSVSINPNPSINSNTVIYELAESGKVRLELRGKSGTLINVLFEGNKEAGSFVQEVDLSNQKSGVYYISLISGKEVISKKFVVAK